MGVIIAPQKLRKGIDSVPGTQRLLKNAVSSPLPSASAPSQEPPCPSSGSLLSPGWWFHVPHAPVTAHLCPLSTPKAPWALRFVYTAGQKDGAVTLKGGALMGKSGHRLEGGAGGGLLKGQFAEGPTCWEPAQAGRWEETPRQRSVAFKLLQMKEERAECGRVPRSSLSWEKGTPPEEQIQA